MKRVAYSLLVAASMMSSSAFAADMPLKAPPPAPAPATPPWDLVITTALMNDYNFRGITQSNHRPSTQGGFEYRYNWNPSLQSYVGVSGESIDFPNQAAAEVDLYGGIRPTFDKLALDFGVWEYYYPDGKCYNTAAFCGSAPIGGAFVPGTAIGVGGAGNVVKQNESFIEFYAKATYTINDQWSTGIQEWYSPSVANTGADGWFTTGNLTFTAPSAWFPSTSGIGGYVSGDLGYWALGTSDAFYGFTKYTSYATWDAGFGWTYKVLTLDLRYYDTNLSKSECNAFTSAQSVSFSPSYVTGQNPSGLGTNWCGAAFVAKLSAAIDFNTNLK
ncbi:MAG TPA: TorF family putative porin [Xanthobacteraceae bacterium]|nr:TorF family putative porin [Xanthobacteraceae bacterium]